MSFDSFRICGDFVHLFAFIILITKMLTSQSCAGISGKTQLLFATVFTLRYLDLFTTYFSLYVTCFKIAFMGLNYLIVFLIFIKFRESYDRKNDSFWNTSLILSACISAVFMNFTLNYNPSERSGDFLKQYFENPLDIIWIISVYLEPVAIIPQLYLIRKTGDGQNVLYYVLALAASRGLYVTHWIYQKVVLNSPYNFYNTIIYPASGLFQLVLLVVVIINILILKKRRPRWQEITEVFTVEAAKLGSSEKAGVYYPKESDTKLLLTPDSAPQY